MSTGTIKKPKSKAQEKRNDAARAVDVLRNLLPNGSMIFARVVGVSRSGMRRRLIVLAIAEYGGIRSIAGLVSSATGLRWNADDTVSVNGCGFSQPQSVAESLGYALYGDAKSIRYES